MAHTSYAPSHNYCLSDNFVFAHPAPLPFQNPRSDILYWGIGSVAYERVASLKIALCNANQLQVAGESAFYVFYVKKKLLAGRKRDG